MLINQRVLFNDDGTEYDHSVALNDSIAGTATIPFVVDEDAIYIASDLPINNKYFVVSTANDQASVVSISSWIDNAWTAAVDVIDGTAVGGKSLAQSGIIRWKTNRLKSWDVEEDSEDVTGVDAVGIYNRYWTKITFSASLKATTALSYIGYKFVESDTELYTFYPELNDSDLKLAFKTGKTDWVDQEIAASEGIITELTTRGIIKTPSQILNTELFKMPAIHKTAHLIFAAMGRSHDEDAAQAKMRYEQSMNMKNFQVDLNASGNLETRERIVTTTFMSR
jgi:hypothetical protein